MEGFLGLVFDFICFLAGVVSRGTGCSVAILGVF